MASEDDPIYIVSDSQFALLSQNRRAGSRYAHETAASQVTKDFGILIFICPIIMGVAIPELGQALLECLTPQQACLYQQGVRDLESRSELRRPDELNTVRAAMQRSFHGITVLETTIQAHHTKAFVDLCWILHGRLPWTEDDDSIAVMSEILDIVPFCGVSDCARATICTTMRWPLMRAAFSISREPPRDAKAKNLLHVACCLYQDVADLRYFSRRIIRPILKSLPSSTPRACLLSQQVLDEECGELLMIRTKKLKLIGGGIKEIVQSETKATSVCQNSCSYVCGRGPAFVRHLFEIKLWPLEVLEHQSPREIVSKLQSFNLEHLSHLKPCSGRKGIDCKGIQMVSTSKLVKDIRNLAKNIDDRNDMPCLACLCGVKIRPHTCWDEEGNAIDL